METHHDEMKSTASNREEIGKSSEHEQTEIYIDPVLERKITRKFDMWVMPQFILIVILSYLDRSNIGNARIFGFEESLNLKGNEFNNLSSLFFVTYVIFEVPWVLLVKRWGANAVMAISIVTWSAVTIGMGFIKNYHQGVATRLLLGLFEAGMFPAMAFMISTIYPRKSQAKRIAVCYGASAISGAFGGLIAYGIQMMGFRHGLEAWRWLFIVEGIISLVCGFICWASFPHSAEKAWFLTTEERELMALRRERDISYTGNEPMSWEYAKMVFTDPVIYIASISLFAAAVPMFGFGIFLPTIIKGLGFSSLRVNYLTIPVYVFACIILSGFTYVSDKLGKRAAVVMWVPIFVMTGYAIALGTKSAGGGFFAMFLCAGVYSYNTILVTWVSNNIKPDNKRSIGLPLVIAIGNAGGAAAGQIYPPRTAPRYVLGNSISLAMEFTALCGIGIIYLIFRRRNQIKDKQRAEGITDNGEKNDKALDFDYIM